MNRTRTPRALVTLAATAAAAAVGLTAVIALAQDPPPPPAEYVATVEPVYYEGHPAYWYNNHWFYRDAHGGWGSYHDEPAFLRDRRMHAAPNRWHYERGGYHHR